ncbi:hypothetical protein [Desulfotignum balticum]|jgi:hypothetical protein|uniref:hypothetical protein n=1 Tax=Desulfotignum balticum TaxID=115781 RepID=UPI000462B613|nr:hypothetical protein [Desulfotignum balticum]
MKSAIHDGALLSDGYLPWKQIIKRIRIKGDAHLLFCLDAAQIVLDNLVPQSLDPFFQALQKLVKPWQLSCRIHFHEMGNVRET